MWKIYKEAATLPNSSPVLAYLPQRRTKTDNLSRLLCHHGSLEPLGVFILRV